MPGRHFSKQGNQGVEAQDLDINPSSPVEVKESSTEESEASNQALCEEQEFLLLVSLSCDSKMRWERLPSQFS